MKTVESMASMKRSDAPNEENALQAFVASPSSDESRGSKDPQSFFQRNPKATKAAAAAAAAAAAGTAAYVGYRSYRKKKRSRQQAQEPDADKHRRGDAAVDKIF